MRWLVFALFAGIFATRVSPTEQLPGKEQLSDWHQKAVLLQQVKDLDQVRAETVAKILGIIEQHNAAMAQELKQEIAAEIYCMSQKYVNLDVDLICATITHESGSWNPEVVSKAGAMGLMQIMPATGQWLSKYENLVWTKATDILFDPIANIRMGSRYLSALIETYDLEGGLAAYNGGSKRVEMWLANNKAMEILWPETRDYVPYVLKIYNEYRETSL